MFLSENHGTVLTGRDLKDNPIPTHRHVPLVLPMRTRSTPGTADRRNPDAAAAVRRRGGGGSWEQRAAMPPPARGIVGAERTPLRLSAVLLKWRRRQRPSVQPAACTGLPAPPLRLPPCLPPLATAPLFRPAGRRWRPRTKNPPMFCCRTSAAASWARAKVTALLSSGSLGPSGRGWSPEPRSAVSSPASARGRCVGW